MTARRRAPSIQKAIHDIDTLKEIGRPREASRPQPDSSSSLSRRLPSKDPFYTSRGFWNDIMDLRWIRVPSSSFKLMMMPIVLYGVTKLAFPNDPNPFESMLFISHHVSDSPPDDPRYSKGPRDILFLAYHIIVFSFIRQFTLFYIIHPFALRLGFKKRAKIERFGEQAYAVLYYGAMGIWGILIMKDLPTWWYQTEYYWRGYPHWDMKASLKRYYLMHWSYWLQQLIIIALKLEKPRTDFKELVAHHIVTVWLIGCSYVTSFTLIGNAVFVSMDIPDVFFALSKICNYLNLERTKIFTFINFFAIWTYFRHWLNLRILWSVWTEYDLIPASSQVFRPLEGYWAVWWLKYQIVLPLLLLQFLNLFWYYLICRILYRAVFGGEVTDVRSDDEDDGNEE